MFPSPQMARPGRLLYYASGVLEMGTPKWRGAMRGYPPRYCYDDVESMRPKPLYTIFTFQDLG